MPDVSIITCARNAEATIRLAIESVANQSFRDFEYIVVNGMSTDGTANIIASRRDVISKVIEAAPNGISDAFNVGIRNATGRYIQFLNADDELLPNKIETSVRIASALQASFVFGDIDFCKGDGSTKYRISGDPHYRRRIRYFCPRINHPTFLTNADAFRVVGEFSTSYKIAMDYDWALRAANMGIYGVYNKEIKVAMKEGGVSSNWRAALNEERAIVQKHGGRLRSIYSVWRYYRTSIRRSLGDFALAALVRGLRNGISFD